MPKPSPNSRDLDCLANLLLTHLGREELSLRTIRVSLGELHIALIKGSINDLDLAREKHAGIADNCLHLQQARVEVCAVLARDLDLGQVTLSQVAARIGSPWNEKIVAARDRLQVLAGEIDLLNRRNQSLIGYCRSHMQQILSLLMTSDKPVTRYGPTGEQMDSAQAHLLVAQG